MSWENVQRAISDTFWRFLNTQGSDWVNTFSFYQAFSDTGLEKYPHRVVLIILKINFFKDWPAKMIFAKNPNCINGPYCFPYKKNHLLENLLNFLKIWHTLLLSAPWSEICVNYFFASWQLPQQILSMFLLSSKLSIGCQCQHLKLDLIIDRI